MNRIVKKANGSIAYTTNSKTVSLSKYATMEVISSDEILVKQGQGESESIYLDALEIQLAPAAPFAWSGTAEMLHDYLLDNFFFDVTGGGTTFDTGNWVFVKTAADLPAPVADPYYFAPAGVIYLEPDTTYVIAPDNGLLDLNGARLETTGMTTIIGGSSETSKITSTGLGSAHLIVSNYTLAMQFVSIEDVTFGVQIDGSLNPPVALDWTGVNFVNVPTVGTIYGCDNFIFTKGALINSQGLTFDGLFGTIGFEFSIFSGTGAAGDIIKVTAGSIITRRFRMVYSSVIATAAATGIDVDVTATIPADGYILDTVNFSGGGTPQAGIDYTDNRALFVNNRGIINSSAVSQYYMLNNAVQTNGIGIGGGGIADPVKVAGTTVSSALTQKFTNGNNIATFTGAFARFFSVTCTFTIQAGNNQQISVYIAKNGAPIAESRSIVTTNGAGRAEGAVSQIITILNTNDTIEAYIGNDSTGGNMTVVNLNMVII